MQCVYCADVYPDAGDLSLYLHFWSGHKQMLDCTLLKVSGVVFSAFLFFLFDHGLIIINIYLLSFIRQLEQQACTHQRYLLLC